MCHHIDKYFMRLTNIYTQFTVVQLNGYHVTSLKIIIIATI